MAMAIRAMVKAITRMNMAKATMINTTTLSMERVTMTKGESPVLSPGGSGN